MSPVLSIQECLKKWQKKPLVNVGPAKHWLTSYKQGVWGYNNNTANVNFWNNLIEDDIILFYSSTGTSGVIGLGVFSNRYIKEAPLWLDDHLSGTNEWPRSIQLKYSYFLGETSSIDTTTPTHKYSSAELNQSIVNISKNAILFSQMANASGGNFPVNSSACKMKDNDLISFITESLLLRNTQLCQYEEYLDNNDNDEDESAQYEYTEEVDLDDLIAKRTFDSNENYRVVPSVTKKERDHTLYRLLKRKYNYQCQSCSFRLLGKRGKYYIEACHITQHSEEGNQDYPENILILCPNCHKSFDHGSPEVVKKIREQVKGNYPESNYKWIE